MAADAERKIPAATRSRALAQAVELAKGYPDLARPGEFVLLYAPVFADYLHDGKLPVNTVRAEGPVSDKTRRT